MKFQDWLDSHGVNLELIRHPKDVSDDGNIIKSEWTARLFYVDIDGPPERHGEFPFTFPAKDPDGNVVEGDETSDEDLTVTLSWLVHNIRGKRISCERRKLDVPKDIDEIVEWRP